MSLQPLDMLPCHPHSIPMYSYPLLISQEAKPQNQVQTYRYPLRLKLLVGSQVWKIYLRAQSRSTDKLRRKSADLHRFVDVPRAHYLDGEQSSVSLPHFRLSKYAIEKLRR